MVRLTLSLCLAAGTAIAAAGQATPPAKEPKPGPKGRVVAPPFPRAMGLPDAPREPGETTEKSIAVAPEVNLKMCVLDGRLKVNGWERNEVRLFVKDGSRAGFRVLEKDGESGKPVWVLVANQSGPRPGAGPDCISGERIEMDVPFKTSLTVSGRTTQMMVDSVRKVWIKNVEGSIALRNIPEGISAETYQGDVSVENSGGAISLQSATGNVIAYEVTPGQIGDVFKAKTNSGTISLQRVDHRQIEANSITGSVLFDGRFLTGGLYNFKTQNGAIRLLIPEATSAIFKAAFGFGAFNSEFPLKVITENVTGGGKEISATLGTGDANVNLTTTSGSIGLKKQQ